MMLSPLYIIFFGKSKRLVGELSKLNILSNKNTVFYSKSLIGRNYSDNDLDKIKEKIYHLK